MFKKYNINVCIEISSSLANDGFANDGFEPHLESIKKVIERLYPNYDDDMAVEVNLDGVFQREEILLIENKEGIYMPKVFSDRHGHYLTEIENQDLKDPENDFYWQTWEQILSSRFYMNDRIYNLHISENGDLWATSAFYYRVD